MNVHWSRTRHACRVLMKLEFSRQIFKKHSKFMKIRPGRADFFYRGRTHTQTRRNSRFSQFWERAKNGKAEMEDISWQQHEQKRVSLCAQEVLRVTSALTLQNSVFQHTVYVCVRMILTTHMYFSPNQH